MSSDTFRLPHLDGSCFMLDGSLFVNIDHAESAGIRADRPELPAINEAAFVRLRELTEENRRLRGDCRECVNAYNRGYTQGMADRTAGQIEEGPPAADQAAGGNAGRDWHPAPKQDSNP